MLTINGTDVHEDIAQLIRTNKMSIRLIGALMGVTLKSTLDALDACEHTPTAEQAFSIMANTSYEAAKRTLIEAAPKEGRFKNYINAFVADFDQWVDQNAREATMTALNEIRHRYTAQYGFPVITAEAVDWITQRTRHAELLEVGAGNGYLARQLQDAGGRRHTNRRLHAYRQRIQPRQDLPHERNPNRRDGRHHGAQRPQPDLVVADAGPSIRKSPQTLQRRVLRLHRRAVKRRLHGRRAV